MNYISPKTWGFGLSVKERRYLKKFFQGVSLTPGNQFMKIIVAQKNRKRGLKSTKVDNSIQKRIILANFYKTKFD